LQGRRAHCRQVRSPHPQRRARVFRTHSNIFFRRWAQSEEFKDKIYFAKFDVDALPELAQELGIRAMPTFVVFKDGDKVGEHMGGNPGPILALLQKWNA
jgi:hypothetical protein